VKTSAQAITLQEGRKSNAIAAIQTDAAATPKAVSSDSAPLRA